MNPWHFIAEFNDFSMIHVFRHFSNSMNFPFMDFFSHFPCFPMVVGTLHNIQ